MADTKISAETPASDLVGAEFAGIQGGANKRFASSLFTASQAQQEAGSSTDVYVTPGRQHFHPSAAKGWINLNGTGTIATRVSRNVTSTTDNGTGDYTVTWDVDFSSADYVQNVSAASSSPAANLCARLGQAATAGTGIAAGTSRMVFGTGGGTPVDCEIACLTAFGDV